MTSLWFINIKSSPLFSRNGMGLLSVVAMIGMISIGTYASFLMIESQNSTFNARQTAQNAELLFQAVRNYRQHHSGGVPKSLENLYQNQESKDCAPYLDTRNGSVLSLQGWCGPYLNQKFEGYSEELYDGWGTDFKWESLSSTLTSCGPDRTCRNSDDLEFKL